MCRPASMIATKDKIFWSKTNESHTDIIEEFGLRERNVRGEYLLVPIEIVPPDNDLLLPLDEWEYSIDIDEYRRDCLPVWYDEEKVERRARAELKEWYRQKIIKPDERRRVKYAQVFCYGEVQAEIGTIVEVYKNGKVKAYDNSIVNAYDNSTVVGYNHSLITAYDNSTVTAYDAAYVNAGGNSTVNSYSRSIVDASGQSKIEAHNDSTVRAYPHSQVEAYDNTTVIAQDGSKIEAYGQCVVEAHCDSEVDGYDASIVVGYDDLSNKRVHSKKATLIDRRKKKIKKAEKKL